MKTKWITGLMLLATMFMLASLQLSAQPDDTMANGPALDPEIEYYGVIDTSMGRIVVELYEDIAPKTVRNFVNLAEGTKPFRHPLTKKTEKAPYYDNTIIHRVSPGFMIQMGDPTGTGSGGPGFTIGEEFNKDVSFDKDLMLAMARTRQPGSSSAQFFITDKGATPRFLDQQYTIFGRAVEGGDVVNKIANVPVTYQPGAPQTPDAKTRPIEDVKLKSVRILRVKKNSDETWQSKLAELDAKKDKPEPKVKAEDSPTTKTTQPTPKKD